MRRESTHHATYTRGMDALRVHDLIAKTANVNYKNTLRVLIALRAVGEELDLAADEILNWPYSGEKPNPEQAIACNRAYLRMNETGRMQKYLYEVEQVI